MRILLTNDDGVHAPGLSALADALGILGDVSVVAPAREQSGVSQTVTFMTPLVTHRVARDGKPWAWAVAGSPADCVKLGASHLLETPPDIVVSGINGGQNAGISTLYSGTVGAAVEGVLNGYTSIAVSMVYDTKARYPRAAAIAVRLIEKLLKRSSGRAELYNINIPLSVIEREYSECDALPVAVVPMDTRAYWDSFDKRTSPRGEHYFWLVGDPDPSISNPAQADGLTDLEALCRGFITVTPLTYDRTHHARLSEMRDWVFD